MAAAASKIIEYYIHKHFESNELIQQRISHHQILDSVSHQLLAIDLKNIQYPFNKERTGSFMGNHIRESITHINISNNSVTGVNEASYPSKSAPLGIFSISDASVCNQRINSYMLSNTNNPLENSTVDNLKTKSLSKHALPKKILSSYSDNSGITYNNLDNATELNDFNESRTYNKEIELNEAENQLNKDFLYINNTYDNFNTDPFKESVGLKPSASCEKSESKEDENAAPRGNITLMGERTINIVLSDLSKFKRIDKKDLEDFKAKWISEKRRKYSSNEKKINGTTEEASNHNALKLDSKDLKKESVSLSKEAKYERLKKDILDLQQ